MEGHLRFLEVKDSDGEGGRRGRMCSEEARRSIGNGILLYIEWLILMLNVAKDSRYHTWIL